MMRDGREQISFMRPPRAVDDLTGFPVSSIPAVNVASVPQRSLLRYPGGKTWLIPHIRAWLGAGDPNRVLVEPFTGGGIVSLTAVMEALARSALLVELDRDVAAFWRAALHHADELVSRINAFAPERTVVERLANTVPDTVVDHGFRTLVLNRTRRGGVLARGASLTRKGENGAGVASRWYADTLAQRLRGIAQYADRLSFYEGDGIGIMEMMADRPDTCIFVDPPYTAPGGKRAGARLYAHSVVDHERIFDVLAASQCDFLMTYDCSTDIVSLVHEHGFHAVVVKMKNTHHARIPELVITREELFT